jgi:hypothetical protein
MSHFLLMPAAGSCIPTETLPAGAVGPITITQPVGQGRLARNLTGDVKTIQEALNQVTVLGVVGGPMPFLAVDGIKGPKTQAAIFSFQKVQVKSIIPDGVIEPTKATILRLNAIVAPVTKFDLNAKLATSLPLVRAGLAAAIQNVTLVFSGPSTPGLAALAQGRLNRHFRLNTLDAPSRFEALRRLLLTYSAMAGVLNQPETIGMLGAIDAFDVDPGNGKIALTQDRAIFEPPLLKGESNPARRIRLGVGFFATAVTPDFAAFILIHELSHFTGQINGQSIGDHGRGWFDTLFIEPLSAAKRMANADSYATFAQECRTGNPDNPGFVKSAPGGLGGAR